MNACALRWIEEAVEKWIGSSNVPAGFALFLKYLGLPPREWAERFFTVERWTEMPRGGHFAAMEEPQLLAEDLNRARYHDEVSQKYLEAAARPWLMVPPDPPDRERRAAPNEVLPRKQ